MSESKPHLKTLEEIERECILGLVEVLRTEGVDGVRHGEASASSRVQVDVTPPVRAFVRA